MPRVAKFDSMQTKTREPTDVAHLISRWTLAEDLDAGSASAYHRKYNKSTAVYEDSSGYVEDVYSEEYWVADDIVFTAWMADSNRHEVLYGIRKASWIEFTLDSALATTDETATNVVLVNWDGGRNPDPAAAGLTVYNMNESGGNYVYHGDAGDVGYATYHIRDNRYYITAMECP